VFLDRDGTLHRELERAPRDPSAIEWFQGVLSALDALARAGFALVVVTNQSAVARGELEFAELEGIHASMARAARFDAVYTCPHHPREGRAPYARACACRKPGHALVSFAAADLGLDLRASWIVGDARRDVLAGLAAGTRAILVATGKGAAEAATLDAAERARIVCLPDFAAAAAHILAAPQAQGR
jgi:D-glycero-D-manno-heptose 1,7-bisphosphate phosphatase